MNDLCFHDNEFSPISSMLISTSYYTTNAEKNISWRVAPFDEDNESILTMLATEDILKREWDTPEEDEQWADL
jgi:hypothetical protein